MEVSDNSKVRAQPEEGTITYRFGNPFSPGSTLYLNLIAKYACTNDCLFCSRPRGESERGKPNIYESSAGTSLYLSKSPSIDEVMAAIASNIKSEDKEITFVGPGEPLLYFPTVLGVLKGIKSNYGIWTRIDTNGSVRLKHADAASQLAEAGLDEIWISVNAISEDEYNALCRPIDKNAYSSMLAFVRECISEGIETKASFISGFYKEGLEERTDLEYLLFAESLGLAWKDVVLRRFIHPL